MRIRVLTMIYYKHGYTDDTMWMANSEGKLKELLHNSVKKSKKQVLNINFKKTVCMMVKK